MNKKCPEESCQSKVSGRDEVRKNGRYVRISDRKWVQRFHCKTCGGGFSSATFSSCFGQKKRHLNSTIEKLFVSNVSMRRIARLLNVHLITVARKKKFLGMRAMEFNLNSLKKLSPEDLKEIQFDDLITFEHTKLKQVAVPVIVVKKTRKIIGIDACRIPTSGLLAEKARRKYGIRPNEHPETLQALFESLRGIIPPQATFTSDSHTSYAPILKRVFPEAHHVQVPGERGCVAGVKRQ